MRTDDAIGNVFRKFRHFASSRLDGFQGHVPMPKSRIVFPQPFRGSRIEVPAEIVKRLFDPADLFQAHVQQFSETDNDVGNLNSGIVNVVLDFDLVTK